MTLHRVDTRFVLPDPVGDAVVLGGLQDWSEGLRQAGVDVAGSPASRGLDLVVAPAALVDDALALRAQQLLVEGRVPLRKLRSAGLVVSQFLAIPNRSKPDLALPVGRREPVRYALRLRPARNALLALRNRAAAPMVASGRLRPGERLITAATRRGGLPFVLAGAPDLSLPTDAAWLLGMGHSPANRNVFYVFEPGSTFPSVVAKFARVPGPSKAIEREREGLELAAGAGATVASHAPKIVARYEAAGHAVLVETAARGQWLKHVLGRAGPGERLRFVDAVAAWIVELGSVTRSSPANLGEARRWFGDEVVPTWVPYGAPGDLIEGLPSLSAVLQHNDLWTENVLVDGDGSFTAVDWEGARPHGLPLSDLLYFLADALAVADGSTGVESRVEHFVRLFRGELPSSRVLFEWTRRGVAASGIPAHSVGTVATLCWLHHGYAPWAAAGTDVSPAALDTTSAAMTRAWLRDPALGPAWDRWKP